MTVFLYIFVSVAPKLWTLVAAGDKDVTAAIAFSLAFFSHMLNHTVMRLQAALYELENPRKPMHVDEGIDKQVYFDIRLQDICFKICM